MSVSYCGSEVDLDTALDSVFHDLQKNINLTHVYVREIATFAERGDDYEVGLIKSLEINDEIDEMLGLFKELKSVISQVIGKPPANIKESMKKLVDDHKLKKKMERDLSRSMSNSSLS